MKKFLALLGAVGLTATASMAVVACGEVSKTNDLSKANTELGELNKPFTTDGKPTNDAILKAFNEANKNKLTTTVEMADVDFGTIAEKTKADEENKKPAVFEVKITAKKATTQADEVKDKFVGEVTVTFTVSAIYKLDKTTSALGDIELPEGAKTDDKLTKEVILAVFNKVNDADVKDADVEISDITATGAKIKAVKDHKTISGEVTVTFKTVAYQEKDLTKLVTKTDLGEQEKQLTDVKTVFDAIKKADDKITFAVTDIKISEIKELKEDADNAEKVTGYEVTVSPADGSKLTGSVTVKWTVKAA